MLFDVEHAFHDEVEKTISFFFLSSYNQAALKCHSKFVTETSIKEWRQIKTGFGKKGEPWERGNYSILK